MKKAKVATPASDHPRTPTDSMAPIKYEPTEDDKIRDGGYDLDHLIRAEEIKGDDKKMEYVKKAHEKKTTQMRSIADLKVAGQALAHKKTSEARGEKNMEEKGEPAHGRVKTRYPKR